MNSSIICLYLFPFTLHASSKRLGHIAISISENEHHPANHGHSALEELRRRFEKDLEHLGRAKEILLPVDMVPIVEEYWTLLYYEFKDPPKAYWKENRDYRRQLTDPLGIPKNEVRKTIKQKNEEFSVLGVTPLTRPGRWV
ncbi:hypothetical protein Gohar_025340 [Gossypium harknessii]|uniref:Uncharacterized protein n=1 Tax=Gossypium harknessii TaxID=34285 RepID=A0A7J9HIP3_9ROSI|nr:hypothetical protein [Gossypium harknessii]